MQVSGGDFKNHCFSPISSLYSTFIAVFARRKISGLFNLRMRRLGYLIFCLMACAMVASSAPPVSTQSDLIRSFEARRGFHRASVLLDSTHSYDMKDLRLDYRVEGGGGPLTGWAHLTVVGRADLSNIIFDVNPLLTVDRVTANGDSVPFHRTDDQLTVNRALAPQEQVDFGFLIAATPNPNSDVGYHVESNHVYTFSEPDGARRWFPCYDQPFDKLDRIEISVNLPDSWWLASNGGLVETAYPAAGRKRQTYRHNRPISTYLVMLAAGNYARRDETVDGVEYRYYTFPEDSAAAAYDWARTPLMVQTFADMFGPYPFEQYGMVQANIMNGWGAMEHQTFTTWGQHLLDGNRTYEPVVAHELAHQWFGDHVTCADFRNIWLNEGFASYCTRLFYQRIDGDSIFEQMMRQDAVAYYNEDSGFRYAMYDPPPSHGFGHVEYEKGNWVLHMLREQLLGDSLFFTAMKRYVQRFAGGTVTTEDFIAVVNETAGQDLRWFFQQWVYEAGHPRLTYSIQAGVPAANDITITIEQTQVNAPVFRFPLKITARMETDTLTRLVWFHEPSETIVEHFPAPVLRAYLASFQPLLVEIKPPQISYDFALGEVYPNPFNAAARIPFELTRPARVHIDLFNINGQFVQTIADNWFFVGNHEVHFQLNPDAASGVYFISMRAADRHFVTKALLLK
jgi:aminopeptidase N